MDNSKPSSSSKTSSAEDAQEQRKSEEQRSTIPPAADSTTDIAVEVKPQSDSAVPETEDAPLLADATENTPDSVAADIGDEATKHSVSHAEKNNKGANADATSDSEDFGNDEQQLVNVMAGRLQEISVLDGEGEEPGPSSGKTQVAYASAGSQEGQSSARIGKPPLSPTGIVRTSSKSPATSHPLQTGEPESISAALLPREGSLDGTDRTAFAQPLRNSASPRSSASASKAPQVDIEEASEDDPLEAYEEQQQRLFRIAEQRRLHREQIAQKCLPSEDIETMRSGLYNARESPTPTELRILNGSFPEGLRGSLFMVGPGRLDINYNVQGELEQTTRSFTFGNLMDALPLLTKISFDPNAKKIVHRSRLVAKQLASRIQMEHGINAKQPGALYLSDTNQTFLNKFIPRPTYHSMPEGECCSQGIQLFVPLEGSSQTVVCTNHTGALQNIDPTDLRPRSVVEIKEINRAFRCSLSSPHMQYDSDTREHFAVLQDVGFRSTTYSVVAFSEAQPGGYRLATFVAAASVLHSFAVTKDYVIVPVYPYEVPIGSPAYRWGDSLLETLAFDRTRPALFHVISREYRRVHCVYRAPAFFALHQINAVQDADQVSVDCVAYEDDTILRRLRIDSLRKASESFAIPSAQLRRYRLQGITVEAQRYAGASRAAQLPQAQPMVLRSEPAELVCVSPAVSSKPYAFVYGVAHKERLQRAGGSSAYQQPIGSTMYNCIVKLSVADASEAPRVWARKHCYPSEPVFVPRSNREDDGYLVSVFFDSMRITSCLLVLDAATFEELMIAQLPATVPLSFGHAKFAI